MKALISSAILFVVLTSTFCTCKNGGVDAPDNTVDTTSHNFAWTIDTLGEGNGSVLNDVAIINDTLAYAVGEIYLKDSTGQFDPTPYNAAKWNGTKWELKRVTVSFRGNMISPPLEGIFAFSPTQIWMVGSLPIYGDGSNWTMYDLRTTLDPNISLSKAWGPNSQDMYFVGRGGSLVYCKSSSWQKLNSGTTLDIRDIWGATESSGGGLQILAIASNNADKRLLQIQGSNVSAVPDSGLSNILYGLWFETKKQYYIVGAGIHFKNALDNSAWNRYSSGVVTSYESGGVRGNNLNDVFVAGSFFELVHYNGSTWRNYRDAIPFGDGALGRIAIKRNLVITVGLAGQKAIAVIGRR